MIYQLQSQNHDTLFQRNEFHHTFQKLTEYSNELKQLVFQLASLWG